MADRFQTATFELRAPLALCEPVGEWGESIVNRRTHLVASGHRATTRGKRPVGSFAVVNRFGTVDVVVMAADRLLAPAACCTEGTECAAPDPRDHAVDNYECYTVKTAAKFQRIKDVRIVRTSGLLTVYDLKRPTRLCTPVVVNEQAMEAPQTYLTCYQAVRAKKVCSPAAPTHARAACKSEEDCGGTQRQTKYCQRQPGAGSVAEMSIASQLGGRRLRVKGKEELCVPPGSAAVSATIGPDGGKLSLGRFEVVVPPAVLPGPVEIAVHELPSQAEEVAPDLDPGQFKPIGPAYAFEAPFVSEEPLTLSLAWDDAELPAGFAVENLGVLLRADQPWIEDPTGAIAGPWPRVLFAPAAGTVDPAAHRVSLAIVGRGTFQLVAMAAPIVGYEGPDLGALAERSAAAPPPPPRFRVEYVGAILPDGDFVKVLLDGLEDAYQEYVVDRGLRAPTGQVVVKVKNIVAGGQAPACVSPDNPRVIYVDPGLPLLHKAAVTMAHEYFHLIQIWNSNQASLTDEGSEANRWFFEGSADWAADEVFKGSHQYHAPDGTYFARPLNAKIGRGDRRAYESVVFWKWLEWKEWNAIRGLLEDHRTRTHTISAPASPENAVQASFVDGLVACYPNILSWLDFATAALYWKTFNPAENDPGELWADDRLGSAKQLPASFADQVATLKRGKPGDGKRNKLDLLYKVAPHLTADAQVIANSAGGDALVGTLRLEFPVPSDPELSAAVIATDTEAETQLLDLTAPRTVSVPFAAQTKVVVITVDPQWKAPEVATPIFQPFTAWVESCGEEGSPPCSCKMTGCPPGDYTCCGDECTTTQWDRNNCGGCGSACGGNEFCCEGTCKDPQTDAANCGYCGNACRGNLECIGGSCACPVGTSLCDTDTCINVTSDPMHCGTCWQSCYDGTCVNGHCICPDETKTFCMFSGCADLQTDNDNCGSCGNHCGDDGTCIQGRCYCLNPAETFCLLPGSGGYCTNLLTDRYNCGYCAATCLTWTCPTSSRETCTAGVCQYDPENCGGCDIACSQTQYCAGPWCVGCPPGTQRCGNGNTCLPPGNCPGG